MRMQQMQVERMRPTAVGLPLARSIDLDLTGSQTCLMRCSYIGPSKMPALPFLLDCMPCLHSLQTRMTDVMQGKCAPVWAGRARTSQPRPRAGGTMVEEDDIHCPYMYSQHCHRRMRTNFSCCLGLIDSGQHKSTHRLLVLVPHEKSQDTMRIFKNLCIPENEANQRPKGARCR